MKTIKISIIIEKPIEKVWIAVIEYFRVNKRSGKIIDTAYSINNYLYYATLISSIKSKNTSNIFAAIKLNSKNRMNESITLLELTLMYSNHYPNNYFGKVLQRLRIRKYYKCESFHILNEFKKRVEKWI